MTVESVEITPSTKVYDLLVAYPELEEVLIGIAPPFKKLKNPLLRRSVAKVATMSHIASVGGVPLNDLINQLRTAVGQSLSGQDYPDQAYFSDRPDWFSPEKIAVSIEEASLENRDAQMTLVTVVREAKGVKKGEIIELVTTFLPAPGIDILKSKGYAVWTCQEEGGVIRSYFLKNS